MDDFERDLTDMLNERVAGMPTSYGPAPELLARAHRPRTTKLTSIAVAALVVIVGTAGVVAQSFGRSDSVGVSAAKPGSAYVATVACPITYALTGGSGFPPPVLGSRLQAGGDPEQSGRLVSYAATNDPRYVVLGPKGWSCRAEVSADGQNAIGLMSPNSPASTTIEGDPIVVINDFLWHGGVGSTLACSAFDDPAVVQYVTQNFPELLPCPRADRTITRVNAHVSTFVTDLGSRGAGWIVLPSSAGADDGKLSVVTCHPTEGLTTDECDTIIADFIARVTPETPIAKAKPIAAAPFAARDVASTANGIVVADERGERVAAYDATADTWRSLSAPRFAGQSQFVATLGNNVYAIAIPTTAAATTEFAVLDVTTGTWRSLAPLPDGVFGRLRMVGDAGHLFGYSATDGEVQRHIAFEYDIAADRWTRLPAPPLSARIGAALQWTGKELLIWGGGDAHQGGIDAFPDGAAYDPATGKWRKLPTAPVAARIEPANVWTGSEMLVWGGTDCGGCGKTPIGAGAAYNPATNEWRTIATAPMRATGAPVAVWTGREMVVFGNLGAGVPAAAYDPATDSWRTLPGAPSSAPVARRGYDPTFASWIGNEMVFGVTAPTETGWVFAAFRYPIGG